MRLRVLTYNMHKGFCFYSRKYVLNELRAVIRDVDADLVFLQEVMGVHPPKNRNLKLESQFEFLADEIWTHHAYGKNAVYSEGHHGNAILSKLPIQSYENINISTNKLESRGLLHAEVNLEDSKKLEKSVHLVCLHLDLLERGRKKQMESLVARVKSAVPDKAPLIIAGDFNDWNKRFSDPLAEKLETEECGVALTGAHAATFPSWKPFLPLDRIYVRGFKIRDYQVLSGAQWKKLSDHAAVTVELDLISSGSRGKS